MLSAARRRCNRPQEDSVATGRNAIVRRSIEEQHHQSASKQACSCFCIFFQLSLGAWLKRHESKQRTNARLGLNAHWNAVYCCATCCFVRLVNLHYNTREQAPYQRVSYTACAVVQVAIDACVRTCSTDGIVAIDTYVHNNSVIAMDACILH